MDTPLVDPEPPIEPFGFCATCHGPIFHGEPISHDSLGMSHRFSTWCDHYRARDKFIAGEMGIKDWSDPNDLRVR